MLHGVVLTNGLDIRQLKDGLPMSTAGAYLAVLDAPDDENAAWIWQSFVPNKIKIFAWLLFKHRPNTRSNLLRKTIIDSATCARCSVAHEDREHLFFSCPLAAQFWPCVEYDY